MTRLALAALVSLCACREYPYAPSRGRPAPDADPRPVTRSSNPYNSARVCQLHMTPCGDADSMPGWVDMCLPPGACMHCPGAAPVCRDGHVIRREPIERLPEVLDALRAELGTVRR